MSPGDTYTTTTSWTFPGSDPDLPTTFPGMDQVMGLGQDAFQSKFERKDAKLRIKEEEHRQKFQAESQKHAYQEQ